MEEDCRLQETEAHRPYCGMSSGGNPCAQSLQGRKLRTKLQYTPNMVPVRTDIKDFPDSHTFTHSYHHPSRLRPDHEWVDWFVQFDRKDPDKMNGLEFVEGLWAQKLALLAVVATIGIIVGSVVWSVLGGDLNTIFTVMGFVLTGVAGELCPIR